MFLNPKLISLVFISLFMLPLPLSALNCKSKADNELVVICSDGKEYAIVTKDQLDSANEKMQQLSLVKQEIEVTKDLLELEKLKNNEQSKLFELMRLKSNEDEKTIDKLLEVKVPHTSWYQTQEFSFAIGMASTLTAFVLWRYTEQFTQ